ncbi:MAG: protein kinase domain-containing protein, partial [Candidatus Acidiferrum sp.]
MTIRDSNNPEPDATPAGSGSLAAREQAVARALADFIDRQAHEEQVNVEVFCRQYPDLAADLGPLLDSLMAMDPETDDGQEAVDPKEGAGDSAPLPEQLSGHKILSEIGAGGMGRVLLAFDAGLHRQVAIKTLRERCSGNKQLESRFMEEARALAQLNHPNIVSIYSLGQPAEPAHFVMEYI